MAASLTVTALVAHQVVASPALLAPFVFGQLLYPGLLVGEIILILQLSAKVHRLGPRAAIVLLAGCAALTGLTISVGVFAWTADAVTGAFAASGTMFGVTALIGFLPRPSQTARSLFVLMAFIGLSLAAVIRFFWHMSAHELLLAIGSVLAFAGLAALDALRTTQLAAEAPEGLTGPPPIVKALALYLAFLDLWLCLLLFGSQLVQGNPASALRDRKAAWANR